jgi:membrane-bound lytic murein transglycosylase D
MKTISEAMMKRFLMGGLIFNGFLLLMTNGFCQITDSTQVNITAVDSATINADSSSALEEEEVLYMVEEEEVSEWSGLSGGEKLATAEMLLETAISWQEQNDILMAEYYYESARGVLELVNKNDLENEVGKYEQILNKLDYFYRDFIKDMDFLPEEISADAVLEGIDIAEGDTLYSENGVFEKAEIVLDTMSLDSLMALKIELPPVPMCENEKVRKAIEFFQGKGRMVFTKWLERAEYNVPLMKKILSEEGLPEELVYLSMIESGFNPKAYSYAHASGPWQFIRSTGRLFGLSSDWWYDERRDPVKATRAAAQYLKRLYWEFNDWYLALAAYNCGERKIQRHIRKYKTNDFWQLKRLPRQTRNYVPTFLAAITIATNPNAYGFEDFVLKNTLPYDSILVSECIDLKIIAEASDTSFEHLKELNPMIVQWCTPPTRDSVWVRIPKGYGAKCQEVIAQIPESEKRSWVRHQVRRGETLSTIARKYRVSIQAIRDIKTNQIGRRNTIRQGQYLLIPAPPSKYLKDWNVTEAKELSFPPEVGDRIVYRVRRGDTLSGIALKYGISVKELRKWNNLGNSNYLQSGQKLLIWLNQKEANIYAGENIIYEGEGVKKNKFHRIRSGESLWSIAKKYDISVEELKRLNGLSGNSIVRPGDELIVAQSNDSETLIYTVKNGDTLWSIAQTYGVRVIDIKELNGIDDNFTIKPGDQLEIPR